MSLELVDRYLLGEPISKPQVVASFLRERSALAAAAPFYRALEAVGPRAADEAFLALRLVLAGREPGDASVRRLRALAGVSRAVATGDGSGVSAVLRRDGKILADLPPESAGRAALGAAARAAYFKELNASDWAAGGHLS